MTIERPILFSAAMVRAILEGRKTQTRRVMELRSKKLLADGYSKQPYDVLPMPNPRKPNGREWVTLSKKTPEGNKGLVIRCRYGQPGDHLWVRETICVENGASNSEIECGHFCYKADDIHGLWTKENGYRTIPAIHTFRWMSRITLEIVNVRVERVQSITREDAISEGISNVWKWDSKMDSIYFSRGVLNPYVANFSVLWDEINEKRGFGWESNPWVWVVTFRRINP